MPLCCGASFVIGVLPRALSGDREHGELRTVAFRLTRGRPANVHAAMLPGGRTTKKRARTASHCRDGARAQRPRTNRPSLRAKCVAFRGEPKENGKKERKCRISGVFDCTPIKANLFVQDHTEEGIVDLNLPVVLNEAQFPEFVHEKIDPGPCCANHLR